MAGTVNSKPRALSAPAACGRNIVGTVGPGEMSGAGAVR
jgi:hypothetical protein